MQYTVLVGCHTVAKFRGDTYPALIETLNRHVLENQIVMVFFPLFSGQLLLAYISRPRYEGPEVDHAMVTHDAKHLYKAGEKRFGTDENTFIHVFSERSSAHLAAVARSYHQAYDNSLEKVTLPMHCPSCSSCFFDFISFLF